MARSPRVQLRSPLRRRKVLARSGWAGLVILLLLSLVDRYGVPNRPASDDWTRFDHQTFTVSKVVDGDTIHISGLGTGETKVRLLGIDAPELHDPATGKPAHFAEQARGYVEARAAGRQVTLRLEQTQTRDRYERLLAYVYLSDNDCLNLDLVHDGEAYADRRFRHSYRPQYEQAESEARRKQRGLWKDLTEADMPAWRRAWLHSHDEP